MTARNEDPNLLVWLRTLQADVNNLKTGAGVKQNNIRLGDWVCNVNDDGCIVATNIKSAAQTVLCDDGGLFEIMWSTPGDITSDDMTALSLPAPVWYPHSTVQIVEVCLFLGDNFMGEGGHLDANFTKNGSIFAVASLGVGELKWVTGTATTVTSSDVISVTMSYEDEVFPIGNCLTALARYQYV